MVRAVVALMLVAGAARDDEKGFEKVFNGENLQGLKFFVEKGDPAVVWRAQGGLLQCRGTPAGYCYTEKKYKDFILRFDWKFVRPAELKDDSAFRGNSGYLLWVGDRHKIWPYALECQGMNRQAGYVYFVDERQKDRNKFVYDDQARARAVKPVGEWNSYEIIAGKGTVEIRINGEKISTVTDHEYSEPGSIGFMSEESEIHWRNIRIRPE